MFFDKYLLSQIVHGVIKALPPSYGTTEEDFEDTYELLSATRHEDALIAVFTNGHYLPLVAYILEGERADCKGWMTDLFGSIEGMDEVGTCDDGLFVVIDNQYATFIGDDALGFEQAEV